MCQRYRQIRCRACFGGGVGRGDGCGAVSGCWCLLPVRRFTVLLADLYVAYLTQKMKVQSGIAMGLGIVEVAGLVAVQFCYVDVLLSRAKPMGGGREGYMLVNQQQLHFFSSFLIMPDASGGNFRVFNQFFRISY